MTKTKKKKTYSNKKASWYSNKVVYMTNRWSTTYNNKSYVYGKPHELPEKDAQWLIDNWYATCCTDCAKKNKECKTC